MKPQAPESQAILESLRRAVFHALERKRRLGQYTVIWQDGRPKTVPLFKKILPYMHLKKLKLKVF